MLSWAVGLGCYLLSQCRHWVEWVEWRVWVDWGGFSSHLLRLLGSLASFGASFSPIIPTFIRPLSTTRVLDFWLRRPLDPLQSGDIIKQFECDIFIWLRQYTTALNGLKRSEWSGDIWGDWRLVRKAPETQSRMNMANVIHRNILSPENRLYYPKELKTGLWSWACVQTAEMDPTGYPGSSSELKRHLIVLQSVTNDDLKWQMILRNSSGGSKSAEITQKEP